MSERLLAVIAALLAALVLGLALFWHPEPPERPLPVAAAPVGGAFTVQSADGPISLDDFRGKVVLLYFGYTYCPDICPTSLMSTAAGLKLLSEQERKQVRTLFISVDPERDTPDRLKEYAAFFDPGILGATASPETLADVAKRYGVFYARQPAEAGSGYVVDHTSETLVVAPDGKLVGRIPHAAAPDVVVAEIRKLLIHP